MGLWLDYSLKVTESSMNSFMHDCYSFVFLSDLSVRFGQLDWFILQWERCFVMGSILQCSISQWQKGTRHVFVLFPLRIKRWGLFILLEFTLSTSCHSSPCITLFVMTLIHREASIEALLKWSHSNRCRQESAYLLMDVMPIYTWSLPWIWTWLCAILSIARQ